VTLPFDSVCIDSLLNGGQTACSCAGTSCHSCSMNSNLEPGPCTVCDDSQRLFNGACVPACPPSHGLVGTGPTGMACIPISPLPVCAGRRLSTDQSTCNCRRSDCHVCHLYDRAAVDCTACRNGKYLLQLQDVHECVAECPDTHKPRGWGSFGRVCVLKVPPPVYGPCHARLLVGTDTPCSCPVHCHRCLLQRGVAPQCSMCKNDYYLHGSECVATCPDGTVSTGTGQFGRKCKTPLA
jgi:hypothetical protein